MATGDGFKETSFTSRDGLKLHARHYPAARPAANRRAVVCLPGLTRNGRDFHDFALALAAHTGTPRDVPTIAASVRPADVMKSMTSSISIGTA